MFEWRLSFKLTIVEDTLSKDSTYPYLPLWKLEMMILPKM